jgi:hypothetical protein
MNGVFDIKAQVEDRKMEAQKEIEQKQKEASKELIEDSRHKENARLNKIAIALTAIAPIVSVIAVFK